MCLVYVVYSADSPLFVGPCWLPNPEYRRWSVCGVQGSRDRISVFDLCVVGLVVLSGTS